MSKNSSVAFAFLSVVSSAFVLAGMNAEAQENAASIIVNGNPIPVTGTVDANITGPVEVTGTIPITGTVDANVTNTVKVSGEVKANVTGSVEVESLPPVKIDATQNEVKASVENEVEIKNDDGDALRVAINTSIREPLVLSYVDDFNNKTGADTLGNWDIPEGHIFVIEYIAARLVCIPEASNILGCAGISEVGLSFSSNGLSDSGASGIFNSFILPRIFENLPPIVPVPQERIFSVSENVRAYVYNGLTFSAQSEPDSNILRANVRISGYLIPLIEPSLSP